jgi:hypothetical protein
MGKVMTPACPEIVGNPDYSQLIVDIANYSKTIT